MIMALLVGMFSHTSQAQITVSNSGDFLAPGTRINNWDIDTMNAEIYDQFTGATGGNQVWDLTGRSFTKESVGVVVDKSTAPSADSFPDANVAVLVVDTLTPPDSI